MWRLQWCPPLKAQLSLVSCWSLGSPGAGSSRPSHLWLWPCLCTADGLGFHLLGKEENPQSGASLFWAPATSSLECHGWRGFLINIQLSAKVKKVSSGFLVALQKSLLVCFCPTGFTVSSEKSSLCWPLSPWWRWAGLLAAPPAPCTQAFCFL